MELSPSEALYKLKQDLLRDGHISGKTRSLIQSSHSFAMRGHRFPFKYYSRCETVFWPGCSLIGTRPDIVKKIPRLLEDRLGKTGLAIDCCFDPLYQNGDIEAVKSASERIRERLKTHGIKRVIVGCTNCKKIFNLFMPEVEIFHILEVIDNKKAHSETNIKDIYLHHPCPTFGFDGLQTMAASVLSDRVDIKGQLNIPSCCGLGGGVGAISTEISNQFSNRVIKESKDNPIVTYCMGCKNKFLKNGKEAYHILELLTDVKPLKKPLSSSRKWTNRFFFSTLQRIKNKRFWFGVSVIFLILIALYLRKSGYISAEALFGFIKQYKILAPALFIIIYSIAPSLFIPSLPLTVGAGFLWGPFWGVVFSITGATLGASVSFLIARYILRDGVKAKFGYARWEFLKEKVERHGWKAVAFARLIPIFPFPVLNYFFGITPIPFIHYFLSSFFFMLPACIAYVAFGSSMGELILKGNLKGLLIGIVIATAAMLLPFALKPMFKKTLPDKDE